MNAIVEGADVPTEAPVLQDAVAEAPPASFTIPGATIEAPQAIVTIIPDVVAQAAPDADPDSAIAPQAAPDPVDGNGSPVVEPVFFKQTGELIEHPPVILPPAVVDVPDEAEVAEYERLVQRTIAEPTSERAKQELLSFKSLKGIA